MATYGKAILDAAGVKLRRFSTATEAGCREWQRAKNNRGYGVVRFDGKTHLAHRVAWLIEHGDWPDPDKVTDHQCDNKACVNVEHLRELPNHLNLRRAIPRGDAEQERQRARWRRADAKRRGNYRYTEGSESNRLV